MSISSANGLNTNFSKLSKLYTKHEFYGLIENIRQWQKPAEVYNINRELHPTCMHNIKTTNE